MRCVPMILACFCTFSVFAQSLEIAGGICKNHFFDNREDNPHYRASYTSGMGPAVMVAFEGTRADRMTLRVTLSYERHSGKINVYEGGLGGGSSLTAEVEKSVIGLGCYPVNLRILKRIDLNIGCAVTRLLDESYQGVIDEWRKGQPSWTIDLNDKYDQFSTRTNFGLSGRIAWDINVSDKHFISPQYSYYYGIFREFEGTPENTRSMRHIFSIGLQIKQK